jgi:putrescine aminotransferase
MALKLARLASGNHYFISTVNGFHGKSLGAVSATGKGTYRKPYLPIIQGVQHVEFGNAQAAEDAIKNLIAVGETVAAMIVEPIQGEAGIVLPPQDYLKQLREICDRYGVFLIFDEIQTGMGRTGTLWACEGYDVVPDILVFGKAFGGGVMPITGIMRGCDADNGDYCTTASVDRRAKGKSMDIGLSHFWGQPVGVCGGDCGTQVYDRKRHPGTDRRKR